MTGTVVVEEKRGVIEKFRNWYRTKFVETGKAQEFERKFDKGIEITKNTIYVVGGICTVALAIFPADGPVGEAIALLATPALAKAVEAGGEIIKDVVFGVKRGIEDNIVHADGKSEINIAASPEELLNHAVNAMNSANDLKGVANDIHGTNNDVIYDEEYIDADYEVVDEVGGRKL